MSLWDRAEVRVLYEALLTVDLPRVEGPAVPTSFWDGLERWLFTGRMARRMVSCPRSAAAVLAGTYGALRELSEDGVRLTVASDADEVLDLAAVPERWGVHPAPFAEVLPPRWTEEPIAFSLTGAWEEGGFAHVARIRYAPRHDIEQTAITGFVRGLWVPESLGESLALRLRTAFDAGELRRRLHLQGERVTADLLSRLGDALGGPTSQRSQVVALVGTGFADRLTGFPEAATRAVPAITDRLVGSWPALSDEGIEGRLFAGQFEPLAGVADVV